VISSDIEEQIYSRYQLAYIDKKKRGSYVIDEATFFKDADQYDRPRKATRGFDGDIQ
jgi:hypothetical protein